MPNFESHHSVGNNLPQRRHGLTAVIGGTAQVLLSYLSLVMRGVLLVIDCPSEIQRIQRTMLRKIPNLTVYLQPIGTGETTHRLIEGYGVDAQREALHLLANAAADDGMGQLRIVGMCAMKQLLQDTAFRDLIGRQIPQHIQKLNGGVLDELLVDYYFGCGGGTGSGAGPELLNALEELVTKNKGCPVRSRVLLCGTVTNLGAEFPNAQQNGGATVELLLSSGLQQTIGDERQQNTRCYYPFEIWPVGRDSVARENYLLALVQAIDANNVTTFLDDVRPNFAADGPCGNFCPVKAEYCEPLPANEVVADISAAYIPAYREILATPADHGMVATVDHRVTTIARAVATADAVLANVMSHSVDELLAQVCEPSMEVVSVVEVTLTDGSTLLLDDVPAAFGTPMTTPTSAKRKLALLRKIEHELDKLYSLAEQEQLDQESILAKCEARTARAFEALQHFTFTGLLTSLNSRLAHADDCILELRAELQTYVNLQSRRDGIAQARHDIQLERSHTERRIAALIRAAEAAQDRSVESQREAYVLAKPIDEAFRELLGASSQSSDDETLRNLLRPIMLDSVAAVTAVGLARILEVRDPSLDTIVTALSAPGKTVGPTWGGKRMPDPLARFVVLPKVSPTLARALRQQFGATNTKDSTSLAFASSVASLNVVMLEISRCREREDVQVPFYAQGLQAAEDSPLRALFLP